MLQTRLEREQREEQFLAPYAVKSGRTKGRRFPEARHEHRTEFQRDRDRIIHSRAFRRLEYKTQVFINGTADHYRTRLTHTFEMAAVGRTMARALNANEDLTEAIALAHDIGHSPFGHCGENALNLLMKEHGGFDHNIQSLRWVESLEQRYPGFAGLNLTWEVRAGLHKHLASRPGFLLDGHPIGPRQFIEAQIADVADDITYHAHDIDDGLDAGLLHEDQLATLEIWRRAMEHVRQEYPDTEPETRTGITIRCLLNMQVADALRHAEAQLEKFRLQSPEDVMNCPERIVACSPELKPHLDRLREFLFQNVYWHATVAEANNEAVEMMSKLFLFYVENPDKMGRKAQGRIVQDGIMRAACDYVSGMTDRYALDEYRKFGLEKA
jgi:dGTPase